MGEKNYVVLLGEGTSDRYRLICATAKGLVIVFCVQYEILLEGEWRVVIRYDTAHGFPHCDVIHPDGSETKIEYKGRSNAEVLTVGQKDIQHNWQKHRARFEREMMK